LLALERGESGRIIRLKIVGEKRTLIIGKELEIRRALSRSHLYSSAFVVRAAREHLSDYPARVSLIGAGWGHGVGLCQIGAAVMADRGHRHEEILSHYFTAAEISKLY
jgi:SpoIID/LytB domain protein